MIPDLASTVRVKRTISINQPTVAQSNAFYDVQVDGLAINLAFLGVQIDVEAGY